MRASRRQQTASHPARPLRTRVWSAGRLLVLALALALTFGAFFYTGMRVANRAREVEVPDVTGRSVAEANEALSSAGLVLRVDGRRSDPSVPAEHVLAQEPEPGTVLRRQRAVRVRVSEGQQDPFVPPVVGQPERSAEIVLTQEHVEIESRAQIRSMTYPAGTVIAQDPAPKQRAGRVNLLVNEGERGVSYVMPDVIGTAASRVVDLLRRRGFRVTVGAEVPYPGLDSGTVVRQTPQAGFQIDYGDAIVLEVSR
jgi:beta-lactam-binding protein with PASTA domain